VSQRQILENSIQLLNTLRGPAKILYAGSAVGFPTVVENIINPTTGAPGASWLPFGLTRGGINVNKTLDTAQRDDVDQILGAYNQDVTDRSYIVSTQLAEVLGDSTQLGIIMEMGAPTALGSAVATQVMRPLDDGDNVMTEYKLAVVFPKGTEGKVLGFVFRRAQINGGEKAFRFDKTDPASPPLEFRCYPDIATTIPSGDAYGRMFEII
jgi:hypothetical protein